MGNRHSLLKYDDELTVSSNYGTGFYSIQGRLRVLEREQARRELKDAIDALEKKIFEELRNSFAVISEENRDIINRINYLEQIQKRVQLENDMFKTTPEERQRFLDMYEEKEQTIEEEMEELDRLNAQQKLR